MTSFEYGIVTDDTLETDYQVLERDRLLDEKRKEAEKKKEKMIVDVESNIAAYRAAHFFCPRSRTVIPIKDSGSIQEHKSLCDYCRSSKIEKDRQQDLMVEGGARMRGILHTIENAKASIDFKRRKIVTEKDQKLENYEIVIKMAEREIRDSKYIIKNKLVEKDKLLAHDYEILREAAQELYDKYLDMSDSARRRCQY